jgi:hypothetical protein
VGGGRRRVPGTVTAGDKTAREIARELGVRTVLEGSIRRAEGRVRIVAQLIDGLSDEHLWAETYDREVEDVFQVQTEVAESITAALKAELTEAERSSVRRIPTDNIAGWDLYVRAIKTSQSFLPAHLPRRRDSSEKPSASTLVLHRSGGLSHRA